MGQMQKRKRLIGSVVAVVILIAFLFYPLNSYVETPGEADNLKKFVQVKDHADKKTGKFMITSVYLKRLTPFRYVMAQFNPHASIENEEYITGGQNDATFTKVQDFYLKSSVNEAIATAYKAAGRHYERQYRGIYVLDVQKNSHFGDKVKVGDTITKVDGQHFDNSLGFQKYLAKKKPGSAVTVSYISNGKSATTTNKLIKLKNGKSGIGVTLTDDVDVKTNVPVKVNAGQLGGPSGGLMFSLEMYAQLTGQNIRHGQNIAGTGTINADGTVGEIGGVDKKIIAAKNAGATIFFVPYIKPTKAVLAAEDDHQTNYEVVKKTAKRYAPNIKVVPVEKFTDALTYLKEHG